MSKGSAPRPIADQKSFRDNWDQTFAKIVEITEDHCESDDEPEDEICIGCSGSGEGMYDGSTCYRCGGSGSEPVEKEDDV